MVDKVIMFRDDAGKLHSTEEAAKHANGITALKKHLAANTSFTEPQVNLICDCLMNWTNFLLEKSK